MFYPFINWEIIDEPNAEEATNTLLKGNLPNDALILVEYYGDGDGSRFIVFSLNNLSSADRPIYHSTLNENIPDMYEAAGFAQIARKGSNLYYFSSNFTSGRSSLRVHLLYLPNRASDTVLP